MHARKLVLAAFLFVACTDQTTDPAPGRSSSGTPNTGRDGASTGDDDSSCDHPKVQTLGAPCCEEHGIDACGAGLFCAKLDGRTVATCYPNHVREPGETCTADVQCLTKSCAASGRCVAGPGDECDPVDGCTKDHVCTVYTGDLRAGPTCHRVGDGDYCLADEDCGRDGLCLSGHCFSGPAKYAGEPCTETSDCIDQTAGCYQGFCQCHKPNSWGCPLGKTCTGGGHAVYGRECK